MSKVNRIRELLGVSDSTSFEELSERHKEILKDVEEE